MQNLRQLAALITLATMLTACASATPIGRLNASLPEDRRAALGTVGVASPCLGPKVEYRVPAKGALAGAGRGAGSGALGTTEMAFAAGSGGGSGGGAAFLGIFATTPLAAIIGSIVGACRAESKEKVEAAEASIKDFTLYNDAAASFNGYFVQEARKFADGPVAELPAPAGVVQAEETEYGRLAGEGINTVAEVAVDSIGLVGPWNVNPALRLVVKGRLSLVRVEDGQQVFFQTLEYRGPEHDFCVWAAEYATLLRQETDTACLELAKLAAEEAFLLNEGAEYDDPAETKFYGLRPEHPKINGWVSPHDLVFRWEAFPRTRDKAIAARVTGVTYDLGIWKADKQNCANGLVYTKEGITGTEHKLEARLEPDTRYVWSVRAAYLLDGKRRSTLWGMTFNKLLPVNYGSLPRCVHYPFRTSSKEEYPNL